MKNNNASLKCEIKTNKKQKKHYRFNFQINKF